MNKRFGIVKTSNKEEQRRKKLGRPIWKIFSFIIQAPLDSRYEPKNELLNGSFSYLRNIEETKTINKWKVKKHDEHCD